jgi:hypothetical protein
MTSWAKIAELLARSAGHQLFFIGGPPRAGTTWLQQLLDAHPTISCGGEGLFMRHLAQPVDRLIEARRAALADKNKTIFAHAEGYSLPDMGDADALIAAGILLALERQRAGKQVRALGEKTPENVFFFERLKRLFPDSKLILIARDPRDLLASSWHMFYRNEHGDNEDEKKTRMIEMALPAIVEGTRLGFELGQKYPDDVINITYEAMLGDTSAIASRLYAFLGVSDDQETVKLCVDKVKFETLAGGRAPGTADNASFFRNAVAGAWPNTLSATMNNMILKEMAWAFPIFNWHV